jgi:CRP/FNR family transcriptional regulator, anaerobic regulatory protein
LPKKEFILKEGQVCDWIGFIESGLVRHFQYKKFEEISCDFSRKNQFITDFESFNSGQASKINLVTLEDTVFYKINKVNVAELYIQNEKFSVAGRMIVERILLRVSKMAESFMNYTPEERYQNFQIEYKDIFEQIPAKFISSFLGIKPESLSRIKKRLSESNS